MGKIFPRLPCKQCDDDSHGYSMSPIGGSLVAIHTKFHDYYMSILQVLFVLHAGTWHGFWTSSVHGISMAFAKEVMGFPSNSVSFPTKLPSKRHEEIPVTFFTGSIWAGQTKSKKYSYQSKSCVAYLVIIKRNGRWLIDIFYFIAGD